MTRRTKKLLLRFGILIICVGITSGGLIMLWAANLKIPDFSSFEERQVAQSTKFYDHTGEVLLYNLGENLRRTVVPSVEISRHIKNATVAIEDAEFYEHRGIKPTAIIRAGLANLAAGRAVQGGSTITQQVVKNSLLTQEKTLSRKLKEAVLALKLERVMQKDDILALYLNESPYGGNIYGIEEASQMFLGKPASDVSLAEAAYLAALPNAPTYYSPYGDHRDKLEERKNLVLRRMQELDFISKNEAEEAKKETVSFLPQDTFTIKAPHFVFYVRAYLEEKYGKEMLERGGLKIITTLNWDWQRETEEVVDEFAPTNETNFNAHNMGVVALEPGTGKIRVMVGSRDYFETENDGNYNVTLARRQPGSSFKPIVYATAFKEGYTPDTIVFDLPTQFQTTCSPIVTQTSEISTDQNCYAPGNYDNKFRGPITFRDALAQSVNIPAIEVLYLTGIRDSLSTARDLGISTLGTANRYGLTLVLGGGEVMPLEITSAYGTFANDGVYNPTASIERIEDATGNVIEEFQSAPRRALESEVARSISDVLSDNNARAPAFGANSPLYFPNRDVAAKTGTTNDYRDMWTVGYSPNLVLGIWVGNNDNTSMEKRVAGFVVAPMWRKIFDRLSVDLPVERFGRPFYAYKNDPGIKPILRGIWWNGTASTTNPEVHSILHWLDKDSPLGPAPINPESDPQYIFWETPIRVWLTGQNQLSQINNLNTIISQ
ncbi:MAG: PBP1A family penicillin-binding protein [Patescibacteria group bacterium]